jgi:hypothetical protein
MILMVINLDKAQRSIIVVVIESGNHRRMELGDPITLESVNNGGLLQPPRYPLNLNLLIAYDADEKKLYEMANGDPLEFLEYLERGRKFYQGIDGIENTETVRRAWKEPK